MGDAKKSEKKVADPSLEESTEDSNEYTEERVQAAREKLEAQQDQARQQYVFLGVPEPEVEVPDPSERPLDEESMSDAEVEALHTQNEVASEGYEPKSGEAYVDEAYDSPDINPDAKEFQLPKSDAPDEFTGPEAADKAAAAGFNPRSVATSTNPEGLIQSNPYDETAPDRVEELTGKSADEIREETGGMEPGDTDPDQGSGADETKG